MLDCQTAYSPSQGQPTPHHGGSQSPFPGFTLPSCESLILGGAHLSLGPLKLSLLLPPYVLRCSRVLKHPPPFPEPAPRHTLRATGSGDTTTSWKPSILLQAEGTANLLQQPELPGQGLLTRSCSHCAGWDTGWLPLAGALGCVWNDQTNI